MSIDLFSDWVEIFKAGSHTDSSGHTKFWSVEDLDEIIKSYNPKKSEAPIVIGHPRTKDPAYGWVEKLKRVGSVLFAKFKQVDQGFADLVKSGRYKKRSISLDGWRLNHVGFLGAVHPAVDGLADFSSVGNGPVFEFALDEFKGETMDSGTGLSFMDFELFKYC